MQFVADGPDVPDALLQAHDEGRVVFFCGAGISYPAGLPGFKGLVDEIYLRVGTTHSTIEHDAYMRGQFDATLDLLERRLPGQRTAVREALVSVLKPKWHRKGATDTHAALLQLARGSDSCLRLVTTNFDRVFERAAKRTAQPFRAYAAPMLPIPKNSRWNGLVYLHGLVPDREDDQGLHRLVLTSGDFGLAYLTERWAARFVSDLFRNYVVCFVGYSINDPVLRYMMDALAADRMLGEVTPTAYALGDCKPGEEREKTIEWEAKGVSPILYEVLGDSNDHSALHRTLHVWADTYRDGILGKERIVVSHALARPSASTKQDDFVGRMLWALSHHSGLPAKRFADFNPTPGLEWLEAFSENRFRHGDLDRFGISPRGDTDDKLRFSLIRRPTPYQRAPWMALVSVGVISSQWDEVVFQLGRWLVRHLNDPALIVWLTRQGGQLHDRWASLIEEKLDHFARLVNEGKTAELDEIRTHAPNAVPGALMHRLWLLLLTGRVKSPWCETDLYRWKRRMTRDGLTATLRLELRELLSPKVALNKPFRGAKDSAPEEPKRIKDLVDWKLVLAADHAHSSLSDLNDDRWQAALPLMLDDFQQLLRDALDLLRELGEADDLRDRSSWDLPSIAQHWQNRGFREWVTLIELLRDAWLATLGRNPGQAHRIAVGWFELPYPTFKRLALFAASQDEGVDQKQWTKWLLTDKGWWLWSVELHREVMRLLTLQGRQLAPGSQKRLETAILRGPPRRMYRDGLDRERWQRNVDRAIWLRLAKLKASGLVLGDLAHQRLGALSACYPNWGLGPHEREEFLHWTSGTGDPDYESSRDVDIAPRTRIELVEWLTKPPPEHRPFYEDTWLDTCRTRFFHSFFALRDLAKEGHWPAERWREALQAWSEESRVLRSWRYAAPVVQLMPDAVIQEIADSVTWWMEAASKSINCHEAILLDLCGRVLALPMEADSGIHQDGKPINEPVTDAINHPVGHVTQALINLWLKDKPGDNDLLPEKIKPLFTRICDVGVDKFRHGRVLLASQLIALYRVDRTWTDSHAHPLFDWSHNSVEAKAAWEGFLWSPRLYPPVLIAFKPHFLSTAQHYSDLGEHSRQFAAFLTYAALGGIDGYTSEDFQTAIAALPQDGLEEVAQALSQAIEGAGEQREDYWKNRVQPFWQRVWPKSRDLASDNIAESLARLCIAAGEEFPTALATIADWLRPIEHPDYVVNRLHESHLCDQSPEAALRLLSSVVTSRPWSPQKLGQCLDAIAKAMPKLRQDPRHQNLVEYWRQCAA